MATKRKHEDDSIAGRLTKRLKTDTIEAEQKFEEVWKTLNDQLGGVQYPTVTEEEVDQWEIKAKEALEKIPRFDRLRFKFPPQLREYLKLTGKAFKDYTDHSPRKGLLQGFYGDFIVDFDELLKSTSYELFEIKTHADTASYDQRIYLFCIYGRSEDCAILVNCDSQDEENFGAVYFFNMRELSNPLLGDNCLERHETRLLRHLILPNYGKIELTIRRNFECGGTDEQSNGQRQRGLFRQPFRPYRF